MRACGRSSGDPERHGRRLHLHPVASYDLADHPRPTGLEEVWRFTPLKRLRGLLDADGVRGGHLAGRSTRRTAVTTSAISDRAGDRAGRPGSRGPDRRARRGHGDGAVLVEVPAEARARPPGAVTLTGPGSSSRSSGTLVIKVGAYAKATVVLEHHGSATYASSVTVLVGDGAQVELVGLQLWADDTVHAGQVAVKVGRDAHVRTLSATPRRRPGPAGRDRRVRRSGRARSSSSGSTSPTPGSTSSTGCSSTTTPRTPSPTSTTAAPCRARARTRSGSATC